jgi:cytochrome c
MHFLPAWLMLAAITATAQTPPADLARKNGCLSCHGLVHKQVGPGFAQIAERYRNDADAPARLASKIRDGSVGTWGRVIMPRQAHVSAADAQALAQWVLSQPAPR